MSKETDKKDSQKTKQLAQKGNINAACDWAITCAKHNDHTKEDYQNLEEAIELLKTHSKKGNQKASLTLSKIYNLQSKDLYEEYSFLEKHLEPEEKNNYIQYQESLNNLAQHWQEITNQQTTTSPKKNASKQSHQR
jgi:hypothetical protein